MIIFRTTNRGPRTTRRGVVLLLTFIIMVVIIIVAAVFLYMTSIQVKEAGNDIASAQALWLAEGGMRKYILRLRDETYTSSNIPDLNESLGAGSYAVACSYDGGSDIYTITSTGTVGEISRKVQQSMVETSAILARGIHADGAHLKVTASRGVINANISCFTSVLPDPIPGTLTVNGTIYEGDEQFKVSPALDISLYYTLADAAGQVKSNWTFDDSQTWTGVWYVTNRVTIESNARIEGSIICEKSIDFASAADNVFIDPTLYDPSQNYPALYAGADISGTGMGKTKTGLQNSTINGLVYASQNIIFDYLLNTTFNGTILSGQNIDLEYASGFILNYNEDIFAPPPAGFTYSAGGARTVIEQKDWQEIVPAG